MRMFKFICQRILIQFIKKQEYLTISKLRDIENKFFILNILIKRVYLIYIEMLKLDLYYISILAISYLY